MSIRSKRRHVKFYNSLTSHPCHFILSHPVEIEFSAFNSTNKSLYNDIQQYMAFSQEHLLTNHGPSFMASPTFGEVWPNFVYTVTCPLPVKLSYIHEYTEMLTGLYKRNRSSIPVYRCLFFILNIY